MRASMLKYSVINVTLALITLVIALVPFHAFLTIWASTAIDHYTALRLWKEVLMLAAALGVLYLLLFDRKVRAHTLPRKLTWLIIAYLVVQVLWALWGVVANDVTPLAAAYGALINCRFLIFFILAWALAVRTDRLERRWPKLLLWPAVIVVIVGLLQVFVLPPDVMKHFGYNPTTIDAVETINSNNDYQRYMSTLRGPNPLGAYLLLPISALMVLLVRYSKSWNWARGLLLVGCLIMLTFSFSRSAWIGAVLSAIALLFLVVKREWWRKARKGIILTTAIVVLAGGAVLGELWSKPAFQNLVFHTEDNSKVEVSSNDARADALIEGAGDVLQDPLGDGVGTAGPASAYNEGNGRIAENYFLQIGQESGLVGISLLTLIMAGVAWLLWQRRYAALPLALLVAFVGITFVNLLSHAWTDDTLAYIWWGLAGLAIGTPVVRHEVTKD